MKVIGVVFFTCADPHHLYDSTSPEYGDSYIPCYDVESMDREKAASLVVGTTFCKDGVWNYYLNIRTAVYMVTVSMGSVGYGDWSPTGEGARVFTIFWLFTSCMFNAQAWGSLSAWLLESYQEMLDKKKLTKEFDAKSIMQIDKDQGGEVDEMEFISHMLLKTNRVDMMTLQDIRRQFAELDASGDGVISKEDIAMLEEKQAAEAAAQAAGTTLGSAGNAGGAGNTAKVMPSDSAHVSVELANSKSGLVSKLHFSPEDGVTMDDRPLMEEGPNAEGPVVKVEHIES